MAQYSVSGIRGNRCRYRFVFSEEDIRDTWSSESGPFLRTTILGATSPLAFEVVVQVWSEVHGGRELRRSPSGVLPGGQDSLELVVHGASLLVGLPDLGGKVSDGREVLPEVHPSVLNTRGEVF